METILIIVATVLISAVIFIPIGAKIRKRIAESKIQSAEVETIFLPKEVNYPYLALAAAVTFVFTLITNLFMKPKIRKIDMIDSLV